MPSETEQEMRCTRTQRVFRLVLLFVGFCAVINPLRAEQGLLKPGDRLRVSVINSRGQLEWERDLTIDAGGRLCPPFLEPVMGEGLTVTGLEAMLTGEYSRRIYRHPQVQVQLLESGPASQVLVLGDVRRPGPLALSDRMSLPEALRRAGGAVPAGNPRVIVKRGGRETAFPLSALEQRGDPSLDVYLLPGDTVVVSNEALAGTAHPCVFIVGAVRAPGRYPVRRELPVREAIARAGGLEEGRRIKCIAAVRIHPPAGRGKERFEVFSFPPREILSGTLGGVSFLKPGEILVISTRPAQDLLAHDQAHLKQFRLLMNQWNQHASVPPEFLRFNARVFK